MCVYIYICIIEHNMNIIYIDMYIELIYIYICTYVYRSRYSNPEKNLENIDSASEI